MQYDDGRSARSKGKTKLAKMRRRRNLTQEQVALAIGISIASYKRLEKGEIDNPKIRWLSSCAIALECDLTEILEPQWLAWSGPFPRPDPSWWGMPEIYLAQHRDRARG